MTSKIRRYFKLKNSSIGTKEEEIQKTEEMHRILKDAPTCDVIEKTRFILDKDSKKVCVYECGHTDLKEKAFVISELQNKYKARVFAVNEEIYGLE